MSSIPGRYKPFPAYLDGGRKDGGWKEHDELEIPGNVNPGSRKSVNLEHDAPQICTALLGSKVERASYPTGGRTRSIRLYLEGDRSVIASQRKTPARAMLEVRVLEELGARGVPVPKVLAFDGRFLFQEDLGNNRLSTSLRKASRLEGEKLLDSALTSLTEMHATAKSANLERHVVTLGERENWRRSLITHTKDLGKFLGLSAPDLPVEELIKRLCVPRPHFIKWDARPPNAAVLKDGRIGWFDWEHCGRRNRLDDVVWLLGDQTVPEWPDVEDRLLDRHLPNFLDGMDPDDARDYLAVYGTLHMCMRLGKIVNKQNKLGLMDWHGVRTAETVDERELAKACNLSIRAARWAGKSSLTADLSPWLSEVARLFQAEAGRIEIMGDAVGDSDALMSQNEIEFCAPPPVNGVDASAKSEIELLSTSILRGCNIYHSGSVIRQEVNLGALSGAHSVQAGPGFADRFIDRFGGLKALNPQDELPEEFLKRLKSPEGAPFIEVLFRATLALEADMAFILRRLGAIEFAQILATPSPQRAFMVWSYCDHQVSRRSMEVGLIGICELLPEKLRRQAGVEGGGFAAAYRSLRSTARRQRQLTYNTSIVVQAAEKRGIPWEPLDGQFTRLGQGKFQQHVNQSATGKTSFVAWKLARSKRITNQLLTELRIPVPKQANTANVDEALKAAEDIGYPVVIKPLDGNGGKGVAAGLRSPNEIPPAFEHAKQFGSGVIIESFVEGQDHRLLVAGGKLVAATKRLPASVTGDGKGTIEALVKELNSDPRRDGFTLVKVTLDSELHRLLDRAGYGLDTVLAKNETFTLRSMANYHAGGTTIDVTDQVHPDNRKMAVRAAQAIGLDIAGIDMLITDIGRSYKAVGGAIVEVNSRPGFDLHTWPSEGQSRDVAGAAIEMMFPSGSYGRVPIALIVGRLGPCSTVSHLLDGILRSAGMTVGIVTRDGAFVDGEPTSSEGAQKRKATQAILRDPRVEAMVSTISPRQAVRQGLLYDLCEVTAILDTASDSDVDEAALGHGVVVRATRGKLVVGAQNRLALKAVQDIDPDRLVLVSRGAGNVAVRKHLEAGRQAVITAREGGRQVIVMLEGEATAATIPIKAIKSVAGRSSRDCLDEYLFAVALAWSMGVSGEDIVSSLTDGFGVAEPVTALNKISRDLNQMSQEFA